MMRLSTILVFYFLVISLGPLGVVTGLNYYQAQNRLHQTIATELRTIADSRVRQLEGFLTDKKTAVAALAHDPTLVEAMAALAAGGATYVKKTVVRDENAVTAESTEGAGELARVVVGAIEEQLDKQ